MSASTSTSDAEVSGESGHTGGREGEAASSRNCTEQLIFMVHVTGSQNLYPLTPSGYPTNFTSDAWSPNFLAPCDFVQWM